MSLGNAEEKERKMREFERKNRHKQTRRKNSNNKISFGEDECAREWDRGCQQREKNYYKVDRLVVHVARVSFTCAMRRHKRRA